eukprot:TRINITY_DN1341_c0_g1_i1.p1 TRINITY_DN1341_c0_g1~~TRINITY_DN1341_c0_g1_i1.p1  ORF type:complete len:482 (+),score=174.39 TRINITY_DN1341_c0_g1_i1:1636-3081(+)
MLLPEIAQSATDPAAASSSSPAASASTASSDASGSRWSRLLSNPLFSAGFGLIGVGAALAGARQAGRHAAYWARRSMVVSLEIPSRDKSYGWFMDWMGTVGMPRSRHTSLETSFHQFENGEVATRVNFVPSPGVQYFQYGHHWIRCERLREKSAIDYSSGQLLESVTLTTVGRTRDVFERLMAEARQHALRNERGSTVLYKAQGGSSWARFGFPRKRKPLDSVILSAGQAERIVADVSDFLNRGDWYNERGIPYRRGYLLHGPPGCGKSSFIVALAGELRLNVCIIDLGSRHVSDDTLPQLLNTAPQRSIVLLEDLDAAVQLHHQQQYHHQQHHQQQQFSSGLTLSGLSNALDGVAATEGGGRLVFMTTNHYERLRDSAPLLVRPGRVDRTEYVGFAQPDQARRLFIKFYPHSPPHDAQRFADLVPAGEFSMAQLQGYLLGYKHEPQLALDNVARELLRRADASASQPAPARSSSVSTTLD